MALRQNELQDSTTKHGSSDVAQFSPYWSDPQKKSSVEWRNCIDLFAVAMTAKLSIAISEVLGTVAKEANRNKVLLIT